MINKENAITRKAGMSYFQIFTIVLSIFAISYLMGVELGVVSAAGTGGKYCCDKTKSGAVCQMVSADQCAGKTSPTKCEDTDFCKPGCCYSKQTGICYENTPSISCNDSREFNKDSAECNIPECIKGCCTMGNSAIWTTEKNCQVESSFRGMPLNFNKNVRSEIQCIFSVQKENKGACVFDTDNGKSCKYITRAECNTRLKIKSDTPNPDFHEGKFCTDSSLSSLNINCKAKASKGCLEGKEDVYFFDSCGNPEDVAQDCNFFKGSYCGKNPSDATKYTCNDINCYIDGKKRLNGESWCEYDGTIGEGKDPVGSRHIKHVCMMGEEKIEPCADYRNEICVQTDTQTNEGDVFSQSSCKVNKWRTCFSFNNLKEDKLVAKCEAEIDCFVNDINIDGNFHFKACVPKYPPGFSFDAPSAEQIESGEKTDTQSQCSIATLTCTETWKWCLLGGWSCVDNCNCHEQVFTNKMNEFCHSLGDCGAWTNYNGDFTDGGYGLTAEKAWPPKLDDAEISKIKSYAQKNPSQKPAEPGDFTLETKNVEALESVSGYEGVLAGISGSLGSPLLAKILSSQDSNISNIAYQTSPGAINYAQYASGSFGSLANGIKEGNVQAPNAMLGAAIGFAVGFGIGYLIGLSTMWSMIIGGIIGLIIFLFMFCTIHKFKVDFQCNQWERPIGGDCNACNQKIDVPCTKYRCESLGQTCNLVNEGTIAQLCIDKCKGRQSVPEITPWNGVTGKLPTAGYVYKTIENGIEITKSDGGCIQPYKKVDFGIKLVQENDPNLECKYAQCKISTDASKPYEEMTTFFGDDSSFLPYHKADIFLPSMEALRHQYNLSQEKIKELSTMNFYVKCKSATGQINPQPYKIKACVDLGPDLIAPVIIGANPEKGSHIAYGKQTQELQVFTDEPSNCRWSKVSNPYDQMENQMSCDTNLTARTNNGWVCKTTLKNLNETIFIKCRDISVNNNTMSESYEYNLIPTISQLEIKNIKPTVGEEIISGTDPANVKLSLETSNGAEDGKAVCQWSGNGFGPDYFTETNSSFHSYEWKLATRGSYYLNFNCLDIAGNNASATTSFSVSIDDSGPQITRVYKSGGLKVVTNEKAECRYGFSSSFNFDNSSVMSGNGFEHGAEWKPVNYYIQCRDDYRNLGGIMKVKGYNL